jgi:single-stranded-DNA-specific exonuclease
MTRTASRTKHDEKRWIPRREQVANTSALASALGVSPVVAGVLAARGVEDESSARALLRPSHEQLHDPNLMLGMRESVARVLRAVETGERILIYGDYDVLYTRFI